MFVKKTELPKFSTGLLVENYISKPSEVEAFLSIPINILKAVFSIPAQIFQFATKANITEAAYQKSIQELLAAQEATRKTQQSMNADQQKLLSLLQQPVQRLPPQPGLPDIPKLGKSPANPNPIEKQKVIAFRKDTDRIAKINTLFPAPKDFSWSTKLASWKWDDYKNLHELTDCVPAAAAHLITCWSANTSDQPKSPSFEEVKLAFDQTKDPDGAGGLTKGGCNVMHFLDYWRQTGLGTDNLDVYVQIKEKDIDELKKTMYYFGGAIIGLKMPAAVAEAQNWQLPASQANNPVGEWLPDSWGGHAAIAVGMSGDQINVISWNRVLQMNIAFYKAYNDESYALFSEKNWILPSGGSPAGSSFTTAFLQENIGSLSKFS
jgi:hypothetical protein